MDEIKSNSENSDSGYSYNIQRLQSIPHDANVFWCERAIGALEKMKNSSQDITIRLSEKKKNCYLPSLDLVPGGKSTVRYVEVRLQALEKKREHFFTCLTMSIPYFLPYVEDITKILTLRLKK